VAFAIITEEAVTISGRSTTSEPWHRLTLPMWETHGRSRGTARPRQSLQGEIDSVQTLFTSSHETTCRSWTTCPVGY